MSWLLNEYYAIDLLTDTARLCAALLTRVLADHQCSHHGFVAGASQCAVLTPDAVLHSCFAEVQRPRSALHAGLARPCTGTAWSQERQQKLFELQQKARLEAYDSPPRNNAQRGRLMKLDMTTVKDTGAAAHNFRLGRGRRSQGSPALHRECVEPGAGSGCEGCSKQPD